MVKRQQPLPSPRSQTPAGPIFCGCVKDCCLIRLEKDGHGGPLRILPPASGRSRTLCTGSFARTATCGGDFPIQSLEHYWGRDEVSRSFAVFGNELDFEDNIVVRATCPEDSPLEVSSK